MNINEVLINTPAMISRRAEEAENLRLKWQQAVETYDNKEAKFVLILKATKQDLKSSEIKYYINESEELFNARLDLVVMESDYRKAEVDVKGLEEHLRAAKMLARIKISEISNLNEGVKNEL